MPSFLDHCCLCCCCLCFCSEKHSRHSKHLLISVLVCCFVLHRRRWISHIAAVCDEAAALAIEAAAAQGLLCAAGRALRLACAVAVGLACAAAVNAAPVGFLGMFCGMLWKGLGLGGAKVCRSNSNNNTAQSAHVSQPRRKHMLSSACSYATTTANNRPSCYPSRRTRHWRWQQAVWPKWRPPFLPPAAGCARRTPPAA